MRICEEPEERRSNEVEDIRGAVTDIGARSNSSSAKFLGRTHMRLEKEQMKKVQSMNMNKRLQKLLKRECKGRKTMETMAALDKQLWNLLKVLQVRSIKLLQKAFYLSAA